jgi:hypothetical protein
VRPLAKAAGGTGGGGQVEVEQHGIEGLHAPQVVGVFDVGGHVDAVARVGKAANHHVAQDGVVFDKQNSHRIQGVVEGGLPCERWVSGPSVAPSDKRCMSIRQPHETRATFMAGAAR